jgi:hypothetical protein
MILDDIVAHKRMEVASRKRAVSLTALRDRPLYHEERRGFLAAIHHAGAIIAEVPRKGSTTKAAAAKRCTAAIALPGSEVAAMSEAAFDQAMSALLAVPWDTKKWREKRRKAGAKKADARRVTGRPLAALGGVRYDEAVQFAQQTISRLP